MVELGRDLGLTSKSSREPCDCARTGDSIGEAGRGLIRRLGKECIHEVFTDIRFCREKV